MSVVPDLILKQDQPHASHVGKALTLPLEQRVVLPALLAPTQAKQELLSAQNAQRELFHIKPEESHAHVAVSENTPKLGHLYVQCVPLGATQTNQEVLHVNYAQLDNTLPSQDLLSAVLVPKAHTL